MTIPSPASASNYEASARAMFPAFYENPVINMLAQQTKWTVSDSDKMPIDMREYVSTGRLWGASQISDQCLMTLAELTHTIPNAANNAYHLQAQFDGYLIVDIEKTCPPQIAAELLGMAGSLYNELSMSGKGYHMIMPLPANFNDYPLATAKRVLREENGHYEILLEHWITFTRKPIPDERYFGQSEDTLPEAPLWEDFYASLAQKAVETVSMDINFDGDKPDIPAEDRIMELILRIPPKKALADFGNDFSRWEFSIMGVLYNRLTEILKAVEDVVDHVYDENDRVWLLYGAVVKTLPHREKHDGYRNGMPILLNNCVALVAQRMAQQQQKDAEDAAEAAGA